MTVLEARGVSFGYGRDVPVLEGFSHAFLPGATTALTGASGRGKSTLLYLLGLMVRPTAGEVRLDGVAVERLRDSERARLRTETFGFVFQDACLDGTRSVLDNVTETALYRDVPLADARRAALDLLERFGVRERARHKPGQISGGQAQRIALCRALLGRPDVLLADEPTGNLDAESAATVLAAFTEHAAGGGCVVIATHDEAVASACDVRVHL